jgi:hypothetical protein
VHARVEIVIAALAFMCSPTSTSPFAIYRLNYSRVYQCAPIRDHEYE